MQIKEYLFSGIEWLKSEPIIAIVILGVVAVLFYFKTKAMFKLVAVILVAAFLIYLLTLLGGITSSGLSHKNDMIHKSEE